MNTKNYFFSKKICTVVLIVCVLFSPFGAPKANASGYPTFDWSNLIPNIWSGITNAATSIGTAATSIATTLDFSWQSIMKNTLDTIAYGLAQRVLSQITENTISWIKGGFHGSPSFAVDTNAIRDEYIEYYAGDAIRQIQDIGVCDFSLNFVNDLTDSVTLSTKKEKLPYMPKCPFDANLTFGASEFYDDFNRGGWNAFAAALGDGGNPYSVQVKTAEEIEQNKSRAIADSDKKLSWSNGFVDLVDTNNCNYPDSVKFQIAENANIPSGQKAMWDKQFCPTTTPGKLVGDSLTKATGINMDRVGFSDNMNKIISALLDELTKNTLKSIFTTEATPAQRASISARLTAREQGILEERMAEDPAVISAVSEANRVGELYYDAVIEYDTSKELLDVEEGVFAKSEKTPLDTEALMVATERFRIAEETMKSYKTELENARRKLNETNRLAKSRISASIVAERGSRTTQITSQPNMATPSPSN